MLPLKILYDISMEISPDMPVYKGRDAKRPIFEVSSNHQTSSAYETRINMDMHTGTHLDAPLHMIKDGETMEYFTEDNIFNDCIVLDLRNVDDGITDDDIRGAVFQYINSDSFHTESSERNGQSKLKKPADQNFQSDRESNIEKAIRGKVVLLQTKNSFEKRESNFIFLADSGADFLLENGALGVGIDTAGIERSQEGHPTHKKLLANKIFIIEGLVLKDVVPGAYILLLVPLKISGVEAAPARAFLMERV